MSEPNYNETVVIPLLQNKFKELTNQNLVLEANLMVERERNAFLSAQIAELQSKVESQSKRKKREEPQLDGQVY
jgi:hypothetical protein